MTRPIPPDIRDYLEAHERWLQNIQKEGQREGQKLARGSLDLSDLDLSGRLLVMVDLAGGNFDRAVLRNADMRESHFAHASFVEAVLDGAQLIQTDVTRADFSRASLRGVQATSLELFYARLSHADLSEGNFYDAGFSGTNLESANLSHADLRYAYFSKAQMAHAILTGARLGRTLLKGVIGLESAVVEWIELGEDEVRQRLEGEEAKRWLLEQAAPS